MFIKHSAIASFDVETTGINPYKGARIFSYSIGWHFENNSDPILEICRLDNSDEKINKRNREYLKWFFADSSIVKIAHNYKFELSFLTTENIYVPIDTKWIDTMILAQVWRNDSPSQALDYLCWELGGYTRELDKKVKAAAKALNNNYQLVNVALMNKYQTADAERPLLLYDFIMPQIVNDTKQYAAYLREMEVVPVTQRMESYGIMIDRENIYNLQEKYGDLLQETQNESFKLLNEFINFNSDEQVARILFRKYQFPIKKLTDTGKASTDKDVLMEMRTEHNHPIFNIILKCRSYSKALSTLKSYLKFANETEIINPNINTNRARTGRQSSSSPNLQNVGKEEVLKNPFPVPLRKSFRARPSHVLFFVDYSGIEMRLIVEATKEPELYNMLLTDPDADLHHPTVECFLGVKEANNLLKKDKKKYKVFRSAFKNTGFCIAYGGSVVKVAFTLGKRVDEIRDGDANYRRRFQRILNFTPAMMEQVRRFGYIETSLGRKLHIPANKAYIGSNYRIQGTAAEILKIAQVKIDRYLQKETNDKVRIILPIHDELIFSYPRNMLTHAENILGEISRLMIEIPGIDIPLRVEWKMSTTDWNAAKDFDVKY